MPVFLTCLMASIAAGQSTSVRGPVSGILYDTPSRSIRPVVGFPGASYLGQATLSDLDAAAVSPDGDSALVVTKGETQVIRGLRSPAPIRISVPELADPIDRFAWAANSSALVVYSAATRRLYRLDVRPTPPVTGPPVNLSDLTGTVTGLATNQDGSQTVIGICDTAQGGFYAVSEDAPPMRIGTTVNPGAAIFASASRELYAIDRDSRQILYFSDGIYGGWEVLGFQEQTAPITDPVGLGLSANGQKLFVAGGSDQLVRSYDLRSRTMLQELGLDAVPQGLSALAATVNVFVLGTRITDEQPIWVLDARLTPSVSFIPAGK